MGKGGGGEVARKMLSMGRRGGGEMKLLCN